MNTELIMGLTATRMVLAAGWQLCNTSTDGFGESKDAASFGGRATHGSDTSTWCCMAQAGQFVVPVNVCTDIGVTEPNALVRILASLTTRNGLGADSEFLLSPSI